MPGSHRYTRLIGFLFGGALAIPPTLFITFHNPVFFSHLGWTLFFIAFIPGLIGLIAGQGIALLFPRYRHFFLNLKIFILVCLLLISIWLGVWGVAVSRSSRTLGPAWPKLVVIGLDAATWDIMDPMIQAGDLPHLASLCRDGARGPLETLSPIWSPVIWTSIATGRLPEHHGITGYYGTRADLKCARAWDITASHGKRTGLFGWLLTWPPENQFVFTIPSWMARSTETIPARYSFIQELNLNRDSSRGDARPLNILFRGILNGWQIPTAIEYTNNPLQIPVDPDEAFIRQHFISVMPCVDVYLALLREQNPQVTCFCLYGMDHLGHRFWKDFDPTGFKESPQKPRPEYKYVIPDYYRLADAAVGRLLAVLPQETTIVVLSDHGMGPDYAAPARYVFNMDRILEAAGMRGWFSVSFAQRRYILHPVIDLTDEQSERVRKTLRDLSLAEQETPLFEISDENGDMILNPQMEMLVDPESPLAVTEGLRVNGQLIPKEELYEIRHLSGSHRSNGILIVKGPEIVLGIRFQDAGVLDIAPTLLAILGLPVSKEMPGRVLEEMFLDGYLDRHPISWVDSYPPPPAVKDETGEEIHIDDRLRGLGYIE